MAKLLTKDEGLAFRRAEQALFERGFQLAQATPKQGHIDLRGIATAIEQHMFVPGRASQGAKLTIGLPGTEQTVAQYNRGLVLKSQAELRQLIAGYITGCERNGMQAEGVRHVFQAYQIALNKKLRDVRSALDELKSGILNDSSFKSIASSDARVYGIEQEARAVIRKERPTLRGGTLFDNAVKRALETDPRWSREYSSAKRWLESGKAAAGKLEAMERNLERSLEKISLIERVGAKGVNEIARSLAEVVRVSGVRIISMGEPVKARQPVREADRVASSLSALFEAPGKFGVIPIKTKVAGAAAALAVAGALAYLYMTLSEEPKVPKKVEPEHDF